MGATVTAVPNGMQLPIDSLPVTLTYSGNFVATMTTVYAGITYVQTYTNDGTHIIAWTSWTAQPPVVTYLEGENDSQLIGENGNLLIAEAS